jgi:hypothetical protein
MRILIIILLFPIITIAQLSGTYTIGGTSPSYATIKEAVTALNTVGISGSCIFNIRKSERFENQAVAQIVLSK